MEILLVGIIINLTLMLCAISLLTGKIRDIEDVLHDIYLDLHDKD